jgi:hypothetical protein
VGGGSGGVQGEYYLDKAVGSNRHSISEGKSCLWVGLQERRTSVKM